ncbi:MAG: phosphoribosylanthranilate isomerase [Bdellovibrionaceae bacterium]|nr:phosphoribosylanthranilate isomerase [Bdellovibrionales bacterium]MCB9253183.1 phosphoribosylanthranilate isomerase [Pseudobdellovibrionaceae bacterium]
MNHPRIQIAGVRDLKEALMLSFSGADHIGFPLGPGISEEELNEGEVAAIASKLPKCATPVLITYLNTALEVQALADKVGMTRIQLHGEIPPAEVEKLKKNEKLYLIKSIVIGKFSPDEIVFKYDPFVDAFITDTYDHASNRSGATGVTHDWGESHRVVKMTKKPVILAGGLRAENVALAIAAVQPAGVDAHTGLEDENGRKDELLVQEFIKNAKQAFSELPSNG